MWCKEGTRCRLELSTSSPTAMDCAGEHCELRYDGTGEVDLLCRKGVTCDTVIDTTGGIDLTCLDGAICTVSGYTTGDFRVNCEDRASCDITVRTGWGRSLIDCGAAESCRVEGLHKYLSLRCPGNKEVVVCGLGAEKRTIFACGEDACEGPVSK